MMRPSEDFVFQESAALDTKTLKRWVTKSVPNHVAKATAAVRRFPRLPVM